MYQKASQVLDLLERFINIIRPKAYNTITKMVIGAGLLQIVESHAKILHAFAIAIFEEYIAQSAILREFLNATSDSTTGLIMIAMGLTYHLIAYLGKDLIDAIKAKQPKIPELQLRLLNGDKKPLDMKSVLRGKLVNIAHKDCIPDNTDDEDNSYRDDDLPDFLQEHIQQMHQLEKLSRPFGVRKNKNQYRERAALIEKWAGSELIYLSLENDSSVLTNDITIKLTLPKHTSSISVEDKYLPNPKDSESIIPIFDGDLIHKPIPIKIYDHIEITQTTDNWHLSWKTHKLHGETTVESSECFLLHVTEETTIDCAVYCDELPKPYKTTFEVKPPLKSSNVDLEELMDDGYYDALLNRVVMDGYVSRMTNELNI